MPSALADSTDIPVIPCTEKIFMWGVLGGPCEQCQEEAEVQAMEFRNSWSVFKDCNHPCNHHNCARGRIKIEAGNWADTTEAHS